MIAAGHVDDMFVGFDVDIAVPVPSLANTTSRMPWRQHASLKSKQQNEVRRQLDRLAIKPTLPCRIQLVRVAWRMLDDDNLAGALKYVRDAVARWAHGLPEVVPLIHDGRAVLDRRGRLRMTRPAAPDGPNSGIEWMAPIQDTRCRVCAASRSRYEGVRVIIAPLG